MKAYVGFLALTLTAQFQVNAQAVSTQERNTDTEISPDVATTTTAVVERMIPQAIVLPRDTPVHLMVLNEVTTKTHSAGHRFKLRVIEPVVVDGKTLIPVGATAWGEVTSAESSGNVGKSGSLEARLLYVDTGSMRIPIEGQTSEKGNSGTGETVIGILALGVLGLFVKGNNAKIKAGEQMIAFTVDDLTIPVAAMP